MAKELIAQSDQNFVANPRRRRLLQGIAQGSVLLIPGVSAAFVVACGSETNPQLKERQQEAVRVQNYIREGFVKPFVDGATSGPDRGLPKTKSTLEAVRIDSFFKDIYRLGQVNKSQLNDTFWVSYRIPTKSNRPDIYKLLDPDPKFPNQGDEYIGFSFTRPNGNNDEVLAYTVSYTPRYPSTRANGFSKDDFKHMMPKVFNMPDNLPDESWTESHLVDEHNQPVKNTILHSPEWRTENGGFAIAEIWAPDSSSHFSVSVVTPRGM